MSKLIKEFKEMTKDMGLYPPLNNNSFFGQGSAFISHLQTHIMTIEHHGI